MIPFDNTYVQLPSQFYARLDPTPVRAPQLMRVNEPLAAQLGIEPSWLRSDDGVATLAGNRVPTGAEPLAQAYAGHQFGSFVPQLGDGRALLLGEVVDSSGRRRDVQLKGSGPTPFSRRGDGRAAVGPVLREYLVSEAMHALGVPTTRALAAVASGEPVFREAPLPGAILTRVAASHVRVGTFQYFAIRQDTDALHALVDHVISRLYPEAADTDNPALSLLRAVMERQAELVARWLGVGFIHGVMNTDNTAVSGETIDFGPCAFMDTFHPARKYSSIDRGGRYAYGAQPKIIGWNLTRLAETLLAVIDPDLDAAIAKATQTVEPFGELMETAWLGVVRAKLGLTTAQDEDRELVMSLLTVMQNGEADFTNTFRALCRAAANPEADGDVRAAFVKPELYEPWAERWRARLATEPDVTPEERRAQMEQVNPAFIPRNHRVEAALDAAIRNDDLSVFDELHAVLSRPYDDQPENADYALPPEPHEVVRATFCGT